MAERESLIEALLREFEELPVRRVTNTTVVMERGPLDAWRAKCGKALYPPDEWSSCPWCKDWAEGQCDHYGGF